MKAAHALWLMAAATGAQACGESIPGSRQTAESGNYVVAFATTPSRVKVGEHFVVDFAVCPRGGAALPQSVRVDAGMPEHRHGMNYRATVTRKAPGRYRAEGLLFHMAGRWELTFDVATASRTERLASSLRIE